MATRIPMTAIPLLLLSVMSIGHAITSPVLAQRSPPSIADADAPELARIGTFSVGTKTQSIDLGPRPQLVVAGTNVGQIETIDRTVSLRFWYPTVDAESAEPISYTQNRFLQNGKTFRLSVPGLAIADAPPLPGRKFPLFVLSHGLAGENVAMTYLAENIASKGYVVVAIGHDDIPNVEGLVLPVAFGNLLANRSLDQQAVIAMLTSDNLDAASEMQVAIDSDKVGLLGYSMGGYGALTTAGATLNPESNSFFRMPPALREIFVDQASTESGKIDALILLAPWGGAPGPRAWTADAISEVKAPTLIIAGDHDDVVDYEGGIKWLFGSLGSRERRLLVYNFARHNIAYDPVTHALAADPDTADYDTLETLTDPVWRTERLNGINQHFITAFLGWHLKGELSMKEYLDVPTLRAGDGTWPLPDGIQMTSAAATEEQPNYWRGFYRRRAVGIELHSNSDAN